MTARLQEEPPTLLEVHSKSFPDNGRIPIRYTVDGENVPPAINIAELPEGTAGLTVLVDSPDGPGGNRVHWVAYNISPTREIPEGARHLGKEGVNSWDALGYTGPDPALGGTRYYFKVYALDDEIPLDDGAAKDDVIAAMEGHVLAWGEFVGHYSRGS